MRNPRIPSQTKWRWEVLPAEEGIDRLSAKWNTLAHAGSLSPTADAIWARCHWRAFGRPNERRLVVHALYDRRRLLAVLPLCRAGTVLRAWSPCINTKHTPYWMFALDEDRPDAAGAILEHLLADADVIDLKRLRAEGPLCAALSAVAKAGHLAAWADPCGGDAVIDIIRPWDRLRRRLHPKVVANTTRRLRNLQRRGRLAFELVAGEPPLARVLQECLALEAAGWKGRNGSPIVARAGTLRFYTELAFEESRAGRLALYTLRADGKLIAFDYCIRAQGKLNVLKESYHPGWSRFSPGNVLRYLLLEREARRGEVASFRLGVPLQWKGAWATRVEPLVRLRLYRRSALGLLGYHAGPAFRAALKRVPALRRAVRWGRSVATTVTDGRTTP